MYREQLYLYNGNRSLRLYYLVHDYPISYTITLSRTRIIPSRTRFQSRSGWGFYCKCSKIDWMSMNEESSRASIRAREAEKAHSIRTFSPGRGAKKKDPNCIQIRVLLWRRGWDSNPRDVSAKLISSVVYHWQIYVWGRSFQAASSRGEKPGAARGCGRSDPFRPELI